MNLLLTFALLAATHSWIWKQRPANDEVRKAADAIRRVLEVSGAGQSLSGPERAATLAWIEVGWLPHDKDDGQLFVFPGLEYANQCKTASPDYDALVTASLLVARDHFPPSVLGMSSSAPWTDWKGGAGLYQQALGREARDPGLGAGLRFGGGKLVVAAAVAALLLMILLWARRRVN